MSEPTATPSPLLFFETINAYQRTEAIKAAIELDVFAALAEGCETAAQLAERCKTSERGIRILCDYLTVIGFLNKAEQRYFNTQDSAIFLNRHSPAYVGGAMEFLLSPALAENFQHVAAAVRKGGTVQTEEGTTSVENPVWIKFARGMAPLMIPAAQQIADLIGGDAAQKLRVLDVAASHGMFGISIAHKYPNAAITALDWANVLTVAKENAEKAGISERYHCIKGSAFEVDFGGPYDIVLITNFLHHFDVPTCESFLKKVHASLAEGGRVYTLEFVPNEDRVSPPGPATFALIMLCSTPRGDAYTFAELASMFANTGFSRSELHGLQPQGDVVISYQ
ncbi:MAG: class I SAM-dependent methyltransferase [Acidobacteria bacterium]|nr:class I SAM-dependent methyltransferase [Acidobacteriota bacterium]